MNVYILFSERVFCATIKNNPSYMLVTEGCERNENFRLLWQHKPSWTYSTLHSLVVTLFFIKVFIFFDVILPVSYILLPSYEYVGPAWQHVLFLHHILSVFVNKPTLDATLRGIIPCIVCLTPILRTRVHLRPAVLWEGRFNLSLGVG